MLWLSYFALIVLMIWKGSGLMMVVPLSQSPRDTLFLEECNNWEGERCLKQKRPVYSCVFCLFFFLSWKNIKESIACLVSFSVFGAEIWNSQVLQFWPNRDLLQPAPAVTFVEHWRGEGQFESACGSNRTPFQVSRVFFLVENNKIIWEQRTKH